MKARDIAKKVGRKEGTVKDRIYRRIRPVVAAALKGIKDEDDAV
jgi:DNA-directed RNA polymerase specialized sigma24 family protein